MHRAAKQGEQPPPRIIDRLEQLDEVQCDKKGLVWNQGTYNDDIANSPIKYFLKAVKKKVERLNSSNADYSKMDSYELFVNSFILIPFEQFGVVINRLQEINSKPKKFDYIYLLTNEQKLLTFDMLSGMVYPKYLYKWLDNMADKAKEIYLGVKNDET